MFSLPLSLSLFHVTHRHTHTLSLSLSLFRCFSFSDSLHLIKLATKCPSVLIIRSERWGGKAEVFTVCRCQNVTVDKCSRPCYLTYVSGMPVCDALSVFVSSLFFVCTCLYAYLCGLLVTKEHTRTNKPPKSPMSAEVLSCCCTVCTRIVWVIQSFSK